jgi:hypothetical protein
MARLTMQPTSRLPLWSSVLVLMAAVVALQGGGLASQRPPGPADAGPLWISESRLDDGRRLLVVVDQAGRRAAVYHLDGTAGTLTLRSTRDLSWDLLVEDFNAQEPKPAALRKMLQLPPPEDPR